MDKISREEFLSQLFEDVMEKFGVRKRSSILAYHWGEIPKHWQYATLKAVEADVAFCFPTTTATQIEEGWRGIARLRVGKPGKLTDEWDKEFAEIWIENNPYRSLHAEGFDNLLAGYCFAHDYAKVAAYILHRVVAVLILARQEYEGSDENTFFQDTLTLMNQTQGLGHFGRDPETP